MRAALFCLLLALVPLGRAYDFITAVPLRWWPGEVEMHLQLDATRAPQLLSDGSFSWDAIASETLQMWNEHMGPVSFSPIISSVTPRDGNGRNEVFFSSAVFGRRFGYHVLAITTIWRIGSQRVESDTIFNSAIDWDSFSGDALPGRVDFRRVALHEFGHALGLDHPDEAGQVQVAIMNSHVSDLDTLAMDDIRGARALYPPNQRFSLRVEIEPPGSGRVSINPNSMDGTYQAGTTVTLTATPHRRNRFNHWHGEDIGFRRTWKLTVVNDEIVTARFSTNVAPRVTLQPRSRHASFGEPVTFQVRASSAAPVQYQWELNGHEVPGANSPRLVVSFPTHAHSGLYTCRITNARGSTMSRPARLVVDGY